MKYKAFANFIFIMIFSLLTLGLNNKDVQANSAIPTKYPIVLVHGWMGFSNVLGVTYFYGVKDYLTSLGYTVYEPQEDMFNTIEVRGQELANNILLILQQSGAQKVNIIAHSMGGLDARYMISTLGLGDKVASLTMISTPNRGTSVADVALQYIPGPLQNALGVLSWFAGCTIDQQNYNTCTQNALVAASEMTTSYVKYVFNPKNPDDPRVAYFSYGASASPFSITPVLYPSYMILLATESQNDGLVSVSSAKWGTYMGTLNTDHLGEIGQLLGFTAGGFRWKSFYASIASNLQKMGY